MAEHLDAILTALSDPKLVATTTQLFSSSTTSAVTLPCAFPLGRWFGLWRPWRRIRGSWWWCCGTATGWTTRSDVDGQQAAALGPSPTPASSGPRPSGCASSRRRGWLQLGPVLLIPISGPACTAALNSDGYSCTSDLLVGVRD